MIIGGCVMPKLISTVDGIVFDNVNFVDTGLQEWCPLEHTGLEAECFVLRAQHNASKLD